MNDKEYAMLSSEVAELNALLEEIPAENTIERVGLESRLRTITEKLKDAQYTNPISTARITFRGEPVWGTHGILADFGAKAASAFTDAVTAVAASLEENLKYMGPIPDKQKNQLLITGTATGSFGFEFEIPQEQGEDLFPESSPVAVALRKVQELFSLTTIGNDDEIAEVVEEIHPRAVKKVADFLDVVKKGKAWCGIETEEGIFRFDSLEQLQQSSERLKEDNLHENDEELVGEFQGILSQSRTFEFLPLGSSDVIRGKISPEIEDPDVLNRDYLHHQIKIKFHIIQFGQGKPRYSLLSLKQIHPIP